MLRKILIGCGLGAALTLAACASGSDTPTTQIDQTLSSENVQSGIVLACGVLKGAEAGWNAYAANHKVSDTNLTNAAGAIAGVEALCTPPYATNTADAIAKVTAAGVAVLTAMASERGGAAATASQ